MGAYITRNGLKVVNISEQILSLVFITCKQTTMPSDVKITAVCKYRRAGADPGFFVRLSKFLLLYNRGV